MKSAQHISAFLAALIISSSCQAQAAGQRDTLVVKLDNSTEMKERRARTAEMRELLWNHWIKYREAKLLIEGVTKEGQETQSEYKIELLAGNVRVLRVSFKQGEHWISGVRIPKSDGGYQAYTLERVLSKNPHGIGTEANVTLLAPDAATPPTGYWLRIKHLDGKMDYF